MTSEIVIKAIVVISIICIGSSIVTIMMPDQLGGYFVGLFAAGIAAPIYWSEKA